MKNRTVPKLLLLGEFDGCVISNEISVVRLSAARGWRLFLV